MKLKNTIGTVLLLLAIHPLNLIAEDTVPPEPFIPLTNKEYAEKMVTEKWGSSEWEHFEVLIQKESKWISTAQNPNSTAYGLGQFLNSTWKTVGCEKTHEPYTQLECTSKYITARYGTPSKALQFHKKNNWY